MTYAFCRIGASPNRRTPVRLSSCVARVLPRRNDPPANSLVAIISPKAVRSLGLDATEVLAPLRIFRAPRERCTNGQPMLTGVEIFTAILIVMQANILRRIEPHDIRRIIVATIEVDVMSVSTGTLSINLVSKIPFVGQSVRRMQKTVDRLISHFVAAICVAI